MPTILALDLSLCATGWCKTSGEGFSFGTIEPKKLRDFERLEYIRDCFIELVQGADLIVMEGLSFASNNPGSQERAGLAYLIRYFLWKTGRSYQLIAPTTLKKFVTGKGNAEKSLVIRDVFRHWNVTVANDNEADAVALAAIGLCLAGTFQPRNKAQEQVIADLQKKQEAA
jgi:crossover junction endodeoxyribonuclease RuvC